MPTSATYSLADRLLYGILDLGYVRPDSAEETARQMLAGGVGILQLRAKDFSRSDVGAIARRLAPLCREMHVPLILNDHPDLVQETDADGAHVGQDDMTVSRAREIVGPNKIIGISTHSLAQADATRASAPDYIGFGPLFATPTKPDYKPIGISDIARVHQRVPHPIFCIGGIKKENLPDVIAAGARQVVIVSGILQAPDICAYCQECLQILAKGPKTAGITPAGQA